MIAVDYFLSAMLNDDVKPSIVSVDVCRDGAILIRLTNAFTAI